MRRFTPEEMDRIWQETEEPEFYAHENIVNPPPKPFSVFSGEELRRAKLPPRVNVLGCGLIALGQISTIIGQGGTGKSRIAMQIAISQILGIPFAGLPTHNVPLRHLLIGNENSIQRQQHDYLRMTSKLTPAEQRLVDTHIFFHVLRDITDSYISLGQEDIKARWLDTLAQYQPDCVYVDPFGEVNEGDINKDADVRRTLRELSRICRSHNPDTAIVVIHHGRTGRQNIAQAVGFDRGNFALGSKALFSACRCQLNVAPKEADGGNGIVLSCGKANDFKPFEPIGLRLDEETMLYQIDTGFDTAAWVDDVEGKTTGKSAAILDAIHAINGGAIAYNDLCKAISSNTGCSLSTARRRVQDAMEKNYVRKNTKGEYALTDKARAVLSNQTQEDLPL